ncbi:actin cytoskeleton-regulatory complex protein PAN1 [Drosophila yakuba]|uniref:DUF753 domain-containing protein n=1 Tax=Drosophila yakuba TaxID=7245 RepID=B4PAE3_DROYA|nr:actin cytoskeleton-regulatory complex protein PAN1 [Drosophila yakuba]EDW90351.1 uncharacterized protein Dyak_GE13217 [Drosophila yakuba]
MRMRLLVIWISLTALLQWSRAQEDNIEEVSLSGGLAGEDSDNKEVQVPGMETSENDEESLGHGQLFLNTTQGPTEDHEPGDASMATQEIPPNGSQEGQIGHQPDEDEKAPEASSAGTNPESDHKLAEDKEEPEKGFGDSGGSPIIEVPQTDKVDQSSGHSHHSPTDTPESSSEVTADSGPPTLSESGVESQPTNKTETPSPDYPADGPQEDTTLSPPDETTLAPPKPTVPEPEKKPLSCYSCMFCNKTITNETKSLCGPIPGKRNGCRTILLIDPNVVPGKKYFLHRGCVSELDMELSRYCVDNEKLCPTCYEDNCNVQNMTEYEVSPGSAAVAHHLEVPFLIWSICLISWQVAFYPPALF